MLKPGDVAARFADDGDLLLAESKLDDGRGGGMWPRTDKQGKEIHDWGRYHQRAMNHIGRNLRSRKDTSETFELGRLDARSKANLREPATYFALHFLFVDADNTGDENGFFARKARHYWDLGTATLDTESVALDYDEDASGTTEESEKAMPFAMRFIRG